MENTWEHITLNQFKAIKAVFDAKPENETDMLVTIASILAGKSEEEILNAPLAEIQPLFVQVQHLNTPPKRSRLKRNYKVGKWALRVTDATSMNVAQWIDFQNYTSDMFKNMAEILSVVLVPKDKTYNEGYDMEELKKELGQMLICDALAVCFFFQKRWLKSMRTTLTCLVGMGMRKKNKELMKRALEVRREVSALLSSL